MTTYDLEAALRRHFGHDRFRPGQAEVIAAVLHGESVLTVMPTGAGKSLCYQLAAMLLPGTALVISPLIALMKDQLDGLPPALAKQATALNYTVEGGEMEARLARVAQGGYRLLYAAPERLRQQPFLHALKQARISLLVVDEAHCVSLWGHDFRPDYLFIAKAWHELGQPPILAMTATATPRVRDDIQAALGQMRLIATGVYRPNLYLEARRFARKDQKWAALVALCQEMEGSGIVYARARASCEELAAGLRDQGISAIHYHARMEDRSAAQERFMSGAARVVVATIAFGMGIDKADVRFILHYDPPKTLENYFQEAGRAGRDGLPARCSLFYTTSDRALLTKWVKDDALSVEALRTVYKVLHRRLGPAGTGLVALADLEREVGAEETRIRVAIQFLETVGLVWRGFDLPRTLTLTLLKPASDQDPEFASFLEAAHLRPGQPVARDAVELSLATGIALPAIESRLLAWDTAGWLKVRGTGRDMLLSLPKPPVDSAQRVEAMLIEYTDGQLGRVADIMRYATTRGCRHAHIGAYFGARPIQGCKACDNCAGKAPPLSKAPPPLKAPPTPTPPSPRTSQENPSLVVLRGVAAVPFPLGRTGLSRALKGLPTSPVRADRFPLFGALGGWTAKAIRAMIDGLIEEGLVDSFERGAYRLLRISQRGARQLAAAGTAQAAPDDRPGHVPTQSRSQPASDLTQSFDEGLFQALLAWRSEEARRARKPPYIIFQNAVLTRIAADRPTNPDDLARIPGIGPHKLAAYGDAVLEIVRARSNPQ
jgi:ATP-dependent DNA helicase RecQ